MRAFAAGLTLAASVLFAACAGSGYTYVKSSSNNTYFKVPKDWKLYGQDDVLDRSQRPREDADATGLRYLAVFDADPAPSLDHDLQTARYPFGLVRVRELDIEERDAFSLASLRNEVVPIDEIIERDLGEIELVERPQSIRMPKGLAGSRLVYTVRTPEGSFTVHQTGLVDPETRIVYFFIVGCEERCFAEHRRTIDEIAESWTIKE
jgi:hypothetical protein